MRYQRFASALLVCLSLMTAEAGDLITSVQQAYQKNVQFQADFVQKTHIELLNKDVTEKGKMVFAKPESGKPGKFDIHYEGAQERRYICNGETLWIYHPKLQEVEVYSDVKEVLTREALSFLGGLGDMTRQFQVKVEPNSWLLLVPKNKKSPFKNIRLRIDPSSFLATEVVLSPRQGNESRYLLSRIQTPAINSAGDFEFQPPAGTEVTTLP